MALQGMWRVFAVLAAFTVAGMSDGADAQMPGAPSKPVYSPIRKFALPFRPAGLWDKPNEACMLCPSAPPACGTSRTRPA
jgi:hypothetical protein